MLNLINLNSALVVAPISMAKIEGSQSASKTVSVFMDMLLPYAPMDSGSTDVAIVTTEGLYMNNTESLSPYALRDKLWRQGDYFRRKFREGIYAAQKAEPRILPHAYEIETFDALRAKASLDFRLLFSFLTTQLTDNRSYQAKVARELERMNLSDSKERVAFLNEEFVWGWLVYKDRITLRENHALRKHKDGQIIICYPGQLMEAQTEAYRLMAHATGSLPNGRCLYVNTATQQDEDISALVTSLDRTSSVRNKIPRIKLTACPS